MTASRGGVSVVGGGASHTTYTPPCQSPTSPTNHRFCIFNHPLPSFSQELPGFLGPEFALMKLTGSYRLSMRAALFVIHVQEESWRLGHKGSHGRTIRPCAKAKGKPQKADLAFYVSLSCEECLRHPPCCYHWPRGPLGLVKQPAGVT